MLLRTLAEKELAHPFSLRQQNHLKRTDPVYAMFAEATERYEDEFFDVLGFVAGMGRSFSDGAVAATASVLTIAFMSGVDALRLVHRLESQRAVAVRGAFVTGVDALRQVHRPE